MCNHYIQQMKKEIGRIKRVYWNIMLKLIETAKLCEFMLSFKLSTRMEEKFVQEIIRDVVRDENPGLAFMSVLVEKLGAFSSVEKSQSRARG